MQTVVFVHGWGVTNLNTYGELPLRLRGEGLKNNFEFDIKEIFLGKYISFYNEVRLPDISLAFHAALNELNLDSKVSFACITHSTGGPMVRDWWNRYGDKSANTISHLIMLAPANYGSALAQLGKGRISRLKSWFNQVEPGQGVLDWLELGSVESWQLNKAWIENGNATIDSGKMFPFVITGQTIDRALYDHLNSYTGELGSDGVVRVAAANLQGRYVKLVQTENIIEMTDEQTRETESYFEIAISEQLFEAPPVPLRIVKGKSHSGKDKGIMNSITRNEKDDSQNTIKAILDCMSVKNVNDYRKLVEQFNSETALVLEDEKVEGYDGKFSIERNFIHDRMTMIIFKLTDDKGYPIVDFDLILTADNSDSPDHLPEGFFVDRQRNSKSPETVTYFINYDIMMGSPEIRSKDGKLLREETKGISHLGIIIKPRPTDGFVRYQQSKYTADSALFNNALKPNSSVMIQIILKRIVDKNVFQLQKLESDKMPSGKQANFKNIVPGDEIKE